MLRLTGRSLAVQEAAQFSDGTPRVFGNFHSRMLGNSRSLPDPDKIEGRLDNRALGKLVQWQKFFATLTGGHRWSLPRFDYQAR